MNETRDVLRVVVLGAGGLGMAATRMLAGKSEMRHVAIADSRGYAFAPDGLDAEVVRRTLLESYGTGVIAIGSSHLRFAYCSGREQAIPELVSRVEACVRKLRDAL